MGGGIIVIGQIRLGQIGFDSIGVADVLRGTLLASDPVFAFPVVVPFTHP
jgi:hypothetical protein